MRISQPGIGQSIARIASDRLLQSLDTSSKCIGSPSVQKVPTLEIKLVGLHVIGLPSYQLLPVLSGELQAELFRYFTGNIFLNGQYICQISYLLLTRESALIGHYNYLIA